MYGGAQQLGSTVALEKIRNTSSEIRKKFPKHINSLKEEAEQGNAKSQAELAMYYLADLPRTYKIDLLNPLNEASRLILKAADNGYDDLYYLAGEIYETGKLASIALGSDMTVSLSREQSVQAIDLVKARYYYEQACSSNVENRWVAMHKLGKAFYEGSELAGEVNYDKSVMYLNPLISYLEDIAPNSEELKEAYDIMSKCYRFGRGIEANEDMADTLMKKSMKLGNTIPWEKNIISSWALK